jgi:hypothetical protein
MHLIPLLPVAMFMTPALAQDLQGHYRFEEGTPGQVATGVGSVLDSGPLAAHGTPYGEPLYVSDAPAWCGGNDVALDLDGVDDYLEFPSTFVFHAPYGDATLEFSAKVPDPGIHTNVLWTTLDLSGDTNRFHLSVNDGGVLHLDYRQGPGSLFTILPPDGTVTLDDDSWTHIAVVRRVQTSGEHEYRFYKNGLLASVRVDLAPQLPNAVGWTVAGRLSPPNHRLQGQLDELRVHTRALEPHEFQFVALAVPYCSPAAPNSFDPQGARLSANGCDSIAENNLGLSAQGVPPGTLGVFFYGSTKAQVPFGNGTICIGGAVNRILPTVLADSNGSASLALDLSQPPFQGGGSGTVTPGSTWNFQLWYRDPAGFPSTFNFSDALEITFAP